MRYNVLFLLSLMVLVVTPGCSEAPPPEPPSAAETATRIATEFVDAYYTQFPEEVYEVGYPDAPMDRLGDHSEEALAAWNQRLDAWHAELSGLDPEELDTAAVPWRFTLERMEALIDRRVCRMDLWNVSPTWTGWQYSVISTLAQQPVDTDDERDAALARAKDIARLVDTELVNLERGMEEGYAAPASNVAAVIDQFTALIETPIEESPFFNPATRTDDESFIEDYREVIETSVVPALETYRDFLVHEYEGHNEIGVAGNPDGAACYDASVRYWSSLEMDPEEIHEAGLREMERIRAEMLDIAVNTFGTDDLLALFDELRSNTEYTFESEQDMLDHVQAAVDRGKAAMPDWFGYVPDVDVNVIPSPAYEKDSGGGFYSAGSADGSRPGTYQVGTYNPQGISRAGQESVAFHESWPGHHLQVTIALLNEDLHPVQRYMYVSGTAEGWGLYSERLADEAGLYSSELSRLGMLSNEAFRAARLVVDPGIHVMGWTRDEAIDYMLENTAEGFDAVSSEVDRYAAAPGQATSYLIGSLEIFRLRAYAQAQLGDDFDIREFHDRVLADGSVTLPMLAASIEAWVEEVRAGEL
ncbi:MAG: DUF885 domain-containing protein [Woeseiaceae bacterium]|nr:DUF885 domain-containing protein [Woeseiaceae bacterium]